MKKILILYASYGGGHLSAANSIKEYIDTYYSDVQTELIDCVKYINKALDKVTTTAYKEMAKKAPWAWGRLYYKSQEGPICKISSTSNKVMALKLNKLLQEYNPDLIICTHPFGSQMCSYLKQKNKIHSKIATIMTDFAPHEQWLIGNNFIDYFFVSHIGMKQMLEDENIPAKKIFVTGIPLSNKFLMHYNKDEILKSLDLHPDKKTVLFFAGGEFGLGKNKTLDILKSLVENCNNIQIVAISGKNTRMKKQFEELVTLTHKQDSVKILSYTNEVPQLMSVSDLVITKPGGLTTTESLASGLPIVVINPIPGQEEENAKFLEDHHVAIWIKENDNPKEILEQLFNSPQEMKNMKINAKLLAKKNSTRDICKILLDDENLY